MLLYNERVMNSRINDFQLMPQPVDTWLQF